MSVSIPVYKDNKLIGFFEDGEAECLGETGSTFYEVNEAGCGVWTELRRLPGEHYALVERSWDELGVTRAPL
jgi:hypothetical protein